MKLISPLIPLWLKVAVTLRAPEAEGRREEETRRRRTKTGGTRNL